jgi:hypothetical protein
LSIRFDGELQMAEVKFQGKVVSGNLDNLDGNQVVVSTSGNAFNKN